MPNNDDVILFPDDMPQKVVRCHNCKYFGDYQGRTICKMWFNTVTDVNGYCFKAEPKNSTNDKA